MARQPLDEYPAPEQVTRMTFVPFMPEGMVALVRDPSGALRLPAGKLTPGEHYLDASLRIPLETAGYRMQRFHPFALDGTQLYAWLDGDRYGPGGSRPYVEADLIVEPSDTAAERLRRSGLTDLAAIVEEAAESFRTQSDESYYAGSLRLLERAYLAATTPEGGSGFGRDHVAWRKAREAVVDGLDRDGTFLDAGCANGLLMESVAGWAAERGLRIEPYGIDLSPGLIELARRRLPQWADRLWVGNAVDWMPPDGRRFDFVHALLDCVPVARRRQMLDHQLARLVVPGGRLLVSEYTGSGASTPARVGDVLRELGFKVAGEARPHDPAFERGASTAWIIAPA